MLNGQRGFLSGGAMKKYIVIGSVIGFFVLLAWAGEIEDGFDDFLVGGQSDAADVFKVGTDTPFSGAEVIDEVGSKTLSSNYTQGSAADTVVSGGTDWYTVQANVHLDDNNSTTDQNDLDVYLYHRWAYDATAVYSASWSLVGSSLDHDGGVSGFDSRMEVELLYPMSWSHRAIQWQYRAEDTDDGDDADITSVYVWLGTPATPTPVSTPTPTSTPTATPTNTPTSTPTNTPTPTPEGWVSWRGNSGTKYNHALVHNARKVAGGTYVETQYTDYWLRVYPNPTPNEVGIHINIGGAKYVSRPDKTGEL